MRALRTAWLSSLALGAVVIADGALAYATEGDAHPFILERLPLPREALWVAALHVHVAAACVALPACLALSSRTLLRRAPRLHRGLGRVVGALVLLALVPSGLWLAPFAKGGGVATAGFVTSALITALAMLAAIRDARAGHVADHRRAALHVLGQLSVAVTSRALLVVADALALPEVPAYVFALWAPVLLTALVVERLAPRRARKEANDVTHAAALRAAALRAP
jgi:uncharacterized membrane protein